MASVHSSEHPDEYFVWPTMNPHPAFGVSEPRCYFCSYIKTTFTPSATPAEINSLMSFNLTCITDWKPCTVRGEIYPFAWRQFEVDAEMRRAIRVRLDSCDLRIEEMVRDSVWVFRARMLSNDAQDGTAGYSASYPARIEETLKGTGVLKPGTPILLGAEWLDRINKLSGVAKGTELIVFGESDSPSDTNVFSEACGTMIATPVALAQVKRATKAAFATDPSQQP
jgi:hypothetical protein